MITESGMERVKPVFSGSRVEAIGGCGNAREWVRFRGRERLGSEGFPGDARGCERIDSRFPMTDSRFQMDV